jgi:hypothetical protein
MFEKDARKTRFRGALSAAIAASVIQWYVLASQCILHRKDMY